jgi:GT2 family glycosyltransferase/LmbE family N-acetylglucosaminyl deacetylase
MRLLVMAPHPGDEILGCGGLIRQCVEAGERVRVIIVTDGAAGGDPALRAAEATAGLALLGAAPPEFWHLPDGALPLGGAIRERYRAAAGSFGPTHLALPAPGEMHPDHRRLTRGLLTALAGHWQGELLFYESATPLSHPNRIYAIDGEAKLAALACHASRQAGGDCAAHARGMACMRGAAVAAPAGEAFLAYDWDGSPQNFFTQRPLISVVIRGDDRGFLRHALASLRLQSYDQLEAIIVWHGPDPLPDPEEAPDLDLTILRGPGPRSANLNAGLAAARGAYVAFLDQDDILLPTHLELLLAELQADPDLDIAYGDCRLVACRAGGNGITTHGTRQIFDREYRPGRLLSGNHIPLHSFLCLLRFARRIGFDESLEAYEDWDFLARAELAGATFRRVPEVVCEYRIYPEEGEEQTLEAVHARKGFIPWGERVAARLLSPGEPAGAALRARMAAGLEAELEEARRELAVLREERDTARAELALLRDGLARSAAWADLPAGRALHDGPVISVLLPVCDPEPALLAEAIRSVEQQGYPRWQLCIVDDAGADPRIAALLDQLETRAAADRRIRISRRRERGGIAAATRTAAGLADGAWLAFLDHDDRLAPDALLEIAAAAWRQPELTALYTDSRTIDLAGGLLHEFRKPDWSPETLLHLNYINHLTAVRRDAWEEAGGVRGCCEGSQDWDLWLRISRLPGFRAAHVARPLYDWRATPDSTAYRGVSAKPYALAAACRGVADHLAARGFTGVAVTPADPAPGVRLTWDAALLPLTAIVPTHANPDDLGRLLAGLAAADYPAGLRVIIVAHRVGDRATELLLADASRRAGWEVMTDGRPFNWSALNNAAAARAATPWLLFLNDDTELPAPDTLCRLCRYLTLSPETGAVGARLLYPPEQGGGVQHDGIITDPGWVAANLGEAHRGAHLMEVPRNVSAVTGACLLTTAEAFRRVGGLDERLASSFNDVDYCLRLRRAGYRILQASDVVLLHRESQTRGAPESGEAQRRLREEADLMRGQWGEFLRERYQMLYRHHCAGTHICAIPDA